MTNLPPTHGPQAAAAMDGSHREPVLDGVRGLAILIVLVNHAVIYSGMGRDFWVDDLVYRLGDSGWFGVDLFFVLSGFLITGILYDAKGSAVYFRSFYGRRVLRIFPLYYGFLIVALLAFPFLLSPEATQSLRANQAWYWLYLSNVFIARDGWSEPAHLGHFWSLAVEEQFYLLWPLVVWALDRKWLMRIAAACFVGALAVRIVMPFGIDETGVYVLLPTRMDALAAGAFLALLTRGRRGTAILGRWPLLVLLACAVPLLLHTFQHRGIGYYLPIERTLGYTLFAGTFASLIALALTVGPNSWLRRLFSGPTLTFFGKYSYGLYVAHAPIIFFLGDYGLRADRLPRLWDSTLPGMVLFALVATTLSIACAVLSYHLWEVRFLRLKKYLPYRDAAPRQASGPLPTVSPRAGVVAGPQGMPTGPAGRTMRPST